MIGTRHPDEEIAFIDVDFATRQSAPAGHLRPMIEEIEWFSAIEPTLTSAYLIKGLLDQAAMSVVYGPSNSGKTFFALDLAYHIAASLVWRERRVDGGTVLYLAAEGGNGIANRMVALRQMYGQQDIPLALRRAGLDLLHPDADVPRVLALAAELACRGPLRLIVIDTLSRVLAGGDENGPVDMTAFVKNIDRIRQATGAHVMVVHHTGKDIARGARGHSSLRAATDTEIEISLDVEGVTKAIVTKQRDHQSGDEYPFSLKSVPLGVDQDGDEITSCVVVPTATKALDNLPPKAVCELMLKAIDEAWESGNPLSTAPQSKKTGRYAPRHLAQLFQLREAVVDKLLTSWLDNAMIIVEVHDSSSKRKGLRVLEWF
jgi:RecA-family ATPase